MGPVSHQGENIIHIYKVRFHSILFISIFRMYLPCKIHHILSSAFLLCPLFSVIRLNVTHSLSLSLYPFQPLSFLPTPPSLLIPPYSSLQTPHPSPLSLTPRHPSSLSSPLRIPGIGWSYFGADPDWSEKQATQLKIELEASLASFDVKVCTIYSIICYLYCCC